MATKTDRNVAHTRAVTKDCDSRLDHARNTIAGLLAVAYRRFGAIQRAAEQLKTSANPGLANTPRSSVHEVVL
jgi:hypothetical protein